MKEILNMLRRGGRKKKDAPMTIRISMERADWFRDESLNRQMTVNFALDKIFPLKKKEHK